MRVDNLTRVWYNSGAATALTVPPRGLERSDLPMHPQSTTSRDKKPRTLEERFHSGVDRSSGPDVCWPWMRAVNRQGYGEISVGSRTDGSRTLLRAHVLAYRLAFGDPPPDKPCILHSCDNPPCCNPRHLWAGTKADNIRDSVRKGRHRNSKRTHCPAGHPYDESNTYVYRGQRICKACRRKRRRRLDC